ncbi:MAG: helix-turn-helix transcriptional regulator [Clostridia bacterium]|nr:helix-turn-helix transcriptional regulator [Clostridia bacterium]
MMTIGETIRKLRRERDITQEGLAEMLGVTSQSVSQWETGRTAPDISQLAPLAHIFEVSADVLLGIDVEKKQSRILELYAEAYDVAASGAHVRAISMTEEALRLYPNSHRLMDFYANEIYLYSHMLPEDVREEHTERAFGYLDRILAECTDPDIRNNSLIMACLWHAQLGNTEEAERLAKTLEGIHFTYGELMGRIHKGTRQYEAYRDEMLGQFTTAVGYLLVDRLPETTDDNGTPMYTEEEQLTLNRTAAEMFRMLFPDGDFFFHAQYLECAYRNMAWIYAGRQDRDNTLFYMRQAAEMAVHFDTVPPDALHTSPAVRGLATEGVWWHDGHNRSHDWLEALETREAYDFVRDDPAFGEILSLLRKTAK